MLDDAKYGSLVGEGRRNSCRDVESVSMWEVSQQASIRTAREALRFSDLKWEQEALAAPGTRVWWGRGPGGERARVTEVAGAVADLEVRQEVEAALADAVGRWGAEASPAVE